MRLPMPPAELFHELCSLYKWWYSLDKWMLQAGGTHSIYMWFLDLGMKIALHTFISIKDVCLHRTPFSHLLITRKNIPSGENMDRWRWQKSSRQIQSSIHILQLVLSRRRCLILMIIRSSDSTISFNVVVKVPASHPSYPSSILSV